MPAIDPRSFRNALGAFATGVTVVTARGSDGRDVGVTANSFNSVSLDPPMVLWSLNKNSSSLAAFVEGGGFAVHILSAEQQSLSDRFASRNPDRFAELEFERGLGGAPLLPDCAAQFQCRLAFRYDGGDHEILVGEVIEFDHSGHAPLIYHGGRYAAVTGLVTPPSTDERERGQGELMHLVSRAYHHLFAAERQEFLERSLTEEAYLVLRLLGTRERLGFDELAAITSTVGTELSPATLTLLRDRGEITCDPEGFSALTDLGRRTMFELAAVRLAREEEVLEKLDRSEVQLLKGLLRRVVKQAQRSDRARAA